MADDDAVVGKDAKPWEIVGKGPVTDEQLAAACDRGVDMKAAIAALLDAAGPNWTARLLRKELARIDPPPPPRPAHRPRKGAIDHLMHHILILEPGNLSASDLAKRLLADVPGFAHSEVALKERIIRARRYLREHSEVVARRNEMISAAVSAFRNFPNSLAASLAARAASAASQGKLIGRVEELFSTAETPMPPSELFSKIVLFQL